MTFLTRQDDQMVWPLLLIWRSESRQFQQRHTTLLNLDPYQTYLHGWELPTGREGTGLVAQVFNVNKITFLYLSVVP
jgi:hypothetical protein